MKIGEVEVVRFNERKPTPKRRVRRVRRKKSFFLFMAQRNKLRTIVVAVMMFLVIGVPTMMGMATPKVATYIEKTKSISISKETVVPYRITYGLEQIDSNRYNLVDLNNPTKTVLVNGKIAAMLEQNYLYSIAIDLNKTSANIEVASDHVSVFGNRIDCDPKTTQLQVTAKDYKIILKKEGEEVQITDLALSKESFDSIKKAGTLSILNFSSLIKE